MDDADVAADPSGTAHATPGGATPRDAARHAPLTCLPFAAEHVPAAAHAAAAAVARLRTRVPEVPRRWLEAEPHAEVLADLLAQGSGWTVLAGGAYAGHLVAWTWGSGADARTFAPETGFAVGPGLPPREARRAVETLVAHAGRGWVEHDVRTHLVAVPFDEAVLRDALSWLGYGIVVVDALRSLGDESLAALPADPPPGVRVRRAGPDDLPAILALDRGLRRHLVEAPTFLVLRHRQNPASIAAGLADPGIATFLAEDAGAPVAFVRAAPPGDDIALLVRDEATSSINGAFTRADRRGGGIAAALVAAVAAWARERGAVRLGVDFESANVVAARFWTRWFTPVVVSYARRLDPAAGSPAASPDPEDVAGTGTA